ncbi:hypothetical protein JCM10213_005937 [Rhodosporidiobolus nylandii]
MAPAPRGTASGQTFDCTEPGCGKTFSRKEYLARHHRSKHSKERPFQCEYCERGFSRSDLLKRHYQTCVEAKAQRGEGGSADGSGPPPAKRRATGTPAAAQGPQTEEPEEMFVLPQPPVQQQQQQQQSAPAYGYPQHLAGPPLVPFGSTNAAAGYEGLPHPTSHPRARTASGSESSASPQDFFSNTSPASLATTAGTSPESTSFFPLAQAPGQGQAGEYALPQPPSALPSAFPPLHHQQQTSYSTPPHSQPPHPSLSLPPSAPSPPSASSSVFAPNTLSTLTLAPGLSGSSGNFTQDEVLASEVLRDLMRSPMQGVPAPRAVGGTGLGEDGKGGQGAGGPWHGAKHAAAAAEGDQGREAASLVGSQGGGAAAGAGYFDAQGGANGALTPTSAYLASLSHPHLSDADVSNKLEESEAARQLAEYFNQGGVGGITALDLGFTVEPTLFPDFVLNPQQGFVAEDEKRFLVPEQKFCLGYLYPWHVPPVSVLSGYAKKATEQLLPSVPVMHAASVNVGEMATHTAFALTVAGGAYEPEGQSFSNEMLVEKRVFLVRGFQAPEKTFDDRFASLQSLLLYQLLGLFHRDPQQQLLSQSFHSALVYMLRALDLPTKIKQTPVQPFRPDWSGDELEERWKEWVKVETWRRVTFIVFLADLEHAMATQTAQHLSLSDMDLDLPSSDRLWGAKSAAEWYAQAKSCLVHTPISFLAAIRALMARATPDPFSAQGVLLVELGRLSSFPLLILSRTLSFLERKTEEALAQIDPFKNLLGGLGVVEDREQESRDVLGRIRRGREVLRKLPGGIARGGGERWFHDIIPTAASFSSPASTSTTSTSPASAHTSDSPSYSTSSLPTPPNPAASLEELLAEFDPQPYKPFYAAGGASRTGNDTYEAAQERLKKHTEGKARDLKVELPDLFGMA